MYYRGKTLFKRLLLGINNQKSLAAIGNKALN